MEAIEVQTCYMRLPEEFLLSLEGLPGYDREAFVTVHEQGTGINSVRINVVKNSAEESLKAMQKSMVLKADATTAVPLQPTPVPWCTSGIYLSQRPSYTFDPCFHAGSYYVQEASSMFIEQAFSQLLDLAKPLKVLDLCAAPGGKSTHIQSLLSNESLLVSNEVIKQRSIVLTDNIIKWGGANVFVSNNDPSAYKKLAGYFDVLVVDAPCSGSGLFRKDNEAINEWSLANVTMCSQRQQRILADALSCLKAGGLLIYATCSYSAQEDEAIADWLLAEMDCESVALDISSFDGIVETHSPKKGATGYRFYPHKVEGEGFFISCFKKIRDDGSTRLKPAKAIKASVNEKKIAEPWLSAGTMEYFFDRDEMIAVPDHLAENFLELRPHLNLVYAGIKMGTVVKNKLLPHHALSQNRMISNNVASVQVAYDEGIKYLQRQELSIKPQTLGWQLVRYQQQALGWINALPNRVNNYYPKEIRILKQHNTSVFGK